MENQMENQHEHELETGAIRIEGLKGLACDIS